jgi:hypothetical protein
VLFTSIRGCTRQVLPWLVQAAREDAPAGAPMPHQLGGDEMLLAIVHPKVR